MKFLKVMLAVLTCLAVTLTGVSKREDVDRMAVPPSYVIENLGELPALIE